MSTSSALADGSKFAKFRYANKMLSGLNAKDLKKLIPQMGAFFSSSIASGVTGHNLQPSLMLGWLPIYIVEDLEVGKSDKRLRFRSIGGQFLAFQEGDNLGVRVRIRLTGTWRFVWLSMLEALYLRGIATIRHRDLQPADIRTEQGGIPFENYAQTHHNAIGPSSNYVPLMAGNKSLFMSQLGQNTRFKNMTINVQKTQWEQSITAPHTLQPSMFYRDKRGNKPLESTTPMREIPNWQKRERYIMHKTFNVITEEEVFINMYIESFIWSKTVGHNGKDDITVNLLLRRYVEPPERIYIDYREQKVIKDKKTVTRCKLKHLGGGKFQTADESSLKAAKELDEYVFTLNGRWNQPYTFKKTKWDRMSGPSKRPFTRRYEKRDKQALYENLVTATPKEVRENLYKDTEDNWHLENGTRHRIVGTLPDDRRAGEWGMLMVNVLWRAGWTASTLVKGAFSAPRLMSDPLLSRISLISNEIKKTKGNDITTVGTTVESLHKYPAIWTDEETKRTQTGYILEDFGFEGDDLDDVFVIKDRQEIFEKMLMYGFKYYKLSGTFRNDNILYFRSPAKIGVASNIHTAPHSTTLKLKVRIEGYNIVVNEGVTYYIGDGGIPTWEMNRNGYHVINKDVKSEMYLYVKEITYRGDDVNLVMYIIHPALGI